jgi:subtilisin family serine protease
MVVHGSGKLLARIGQQHFNYMQSAGFRAGLLPGFQIKPLFRARQVAGQTLARAGQPRPDWIVVSPSPQPGKHPWDIAYEHARGVAPRSQAIAALGGVYLEPDLLQPGPPGPPPGLAAQGLNPNYPPGAADGFVPAWHLGAGFANFLAAWAAGAKGQGVRIAHLDTGCWPQHVSTPKNLRLEQGYNFYEDNSNVVDPGLGGLFNNPGHGTATLALLAGNTVNLTFDGQNYTGPIGGAPEAEIVPVRIGASVIHLYTEALAQGLDYACAPGEFAPCQVVSLSHGGLPSSAWAEAVNRCYEAGVLVVAAAGDSYYAVVTDLATHFTVYPAAFNRVLTATGVTYHQDPYKTTVPLAMQGCWGPATVMAKAVGAFTPNVPWMTRGTVDGWDMNGAGTSASTPQIAAACALWLGLYGARFSVPWQRAAACREALLNTAARPGASPDEIGRGSLDASALLGPAMAAKLEAMVTNGQFQETPPDEVSFPFWRVMFGFGPPQSGLEQMYETEAAQILARSTNGFLIATVQKDPAGTTISPAERKQWQEAFIAEPGRSNALRAKLQAAA